MYKAIFIWGAMLAAAFIAPAAAQTSAEEGDEGAAAVASSPDAGLEYAVCGDGLKLRTGPKPEAGVIAVLSAGAVVECGGEEERYWVESGAEATFVYWTKIRAGDVYGWVLRKYLVPRYQYDAYREADRLGKAGDAAAMVAALNAANAALTTNGRYGGQVIRSPDGRKVFVDPPYSGNYADYFPGIDFGWPPYLYFEVGRGLVRRWDHSLPDLWSDDARYFVYTEYVRFGEAPFYIFDTVTMNEKLLGYRGGELSLTYVGGYFLWLDYNPTGYFGEPRLAAYDAAEGKTTILLDADPSTVRETTSAGHEVKLVPTGAGPAALRGSELFIKFNGAYIARSEEGA